jgi:hypothetical protein
MNCAAYSQPPVAVSRVIHLLQAYLKIHVYTFIVLRLPRSAEKEQPAYHK